MTEAKFKKVWNLLSNYNFVINKNENTEFLCKICKKIMIEPYIGPCGCRYCCNCIKEYICDEEKYCPGETEGCSEDFLDFRTNLHRDTVLCRKIIKIIVKCPSESCEVRSNLENIEEHIDICMVEPLVCPYGSFGCTQQRKRNDNLNVHLNLNQEKHTKLLMLMINNFRNDLIEMKKNMELKEREIIELKEETSRNKSEIEEMKTISRRKEIIVRNEISDIKHESKIQRDSCKRENMKDEKNKLTALETKLVINENKISLLEKDSKTKDDRITILETLLVNYKKKTSEFEKELITKEKLEENEKTKKEINELKLRIDILNIKTNSVITTGEINWTVDTFKERKNNDDCIFSRYFYSHSKGYKLRLKVFPRGIGKGRDKHLSVYLVICEGEYDNILSWPCKHFFKLSIVNQWTKEEHKSQTFQNLSTEYGRSSFEKPTTKMNTAFGYDTFILHTDLELLEGLKVNDSIIIKCTVKAPIR